MGIDTLIYVATSDCGEPNIRVGLLDGCSIKPADTISAQKGATHEICTPWRFYSPEYERGPWPLIAATLMMLYAADNVKAVWYFGDIDYTAEPFTPDDVVAHSLHYMHKKHGLKEK